MRRALLLLLSGCFLHPTGGPPGRFVYARGTFEGSEGVFIKRIGGHERRLLGGDGSTTVQPTLVDSRGRVIYSRDADRALCRRGRCDAGHPDGYYWIDPDVGEEHYLFRYANNLRLLAGDRLVYQAGATNHDELDSVQTDGRGAVVIAKAGWLCGGTGDGRMAYIDLDRKEMIVAATDGSDPHVIGEGVEGNCTEAYGVDEVTNGILADGQLVFEGHPVGGGQTGEYVATLDGATRLLTTDTVAVMAAMPGDRFVVQTYTVEANGLTMRERVEIVAPGAPPTLSLPMLNDHTTDYSAAFMSIDDVTPSGRLILGKFVPRTATPAADFYSIGADGVPVLLASTAQYYGTTHDGHVIYEQIASFDRSDQPVRGTWSVPDTGGAAVLISAGRPVKVVGDWIVWEIDGDGGWSFGTVRPDGTQRHVIAAAKDGGVGDDGVVGGEWITYRKGDDLRIARLDGSDDVRIAGDGASFPRFVPDPVKAPTRPRARRRRPPAAR